MNSRNKGVRGERRVRDLYRNAGWEARRGQQYAGHPDAPDVLVVGVSEFIHLEVKETKRVQLRDWVLKADADCAGKAWAIHYHLPQTGRDLVIIEFPTFAKLLRDGL